MDRNEPWEAIARRTAMRLERAGYGQQRPILDEIARETGYVASSLRSMVTVLRFLEFLETDDPDLAARARNLSYIVLAIFERWWSHDPDGAREALTSFLDFPKNVRDLAEREKAARRRTRPAAAGSGDIPDEEPVSSIVVLSQGAAPRIRAPGRASLLSVLQHHRFIRDNRPSHDGSRTRARSWEGQHLAWAAADDLWRRRKVGAVGYVGDHPAIAAFEVRPPSSLDLLRERVPELILRGHGLRSAVDCVLLILPDAKAAEVFDRIDLGDPYVNGSREVWWLYRDPV